MSRLFLRPTCMLSLSLLALVVANSSASAQIPLNVTASASDLSPQWVPVPDVDPNNPTIASTQLSATVNNPPTAPYPCTAVGPFWSWTIDQTQVQYSSDGSSFTPGGSSDFSAWIIQPDPTSSAATLNVRYSTGGYWHFPCVATAVYDDGACGDTWRGTATASPEGTSVQLISMTVVSGATQTNVTGATNWAAVMTYPGDTVIVQATTLPNNADGWSQIVWTGGSAGFSANQRTVDKGTSAKNIVVSAIGGVQFSVTVWIVWANLTIQIADKRADDNNAETFTDNGGNWRDDVGGGTALGAIDHDSVPGLRYAYTIGKIQATGKLTPPGVGSIIETDAWKIKRTKESVAWDNGGHYKDTSDSTTWTPGPSLSNQAGTDDTGDSAYSDLDPTSGGSIDTIYDVDFPGCSTILSGITIYHTSEYYGNFTQYVTVTLDTEQTCSANAYWSYQAQVDGDKAVGSRIDLNKLGTALIDVAARKKNGPNYAKR